MSILVTKYEKRNKKYKKTMFEIARKRGIGYEQKEIANALNITQGRVSQLLAELRVIAKKYGIEGTWNWLVEEN